MPRDPFPTSLARSASDASFTTPRIARFTTVCAARVATRRVPVRLVAVLLAATTAFARQDVAPAPQGAPEPAAAPAASPRPSTVDLEHLIAEMTDPHALARFPSPAFRARQESSRDPASTAPDAEGWFGNRDAGNFVRVEERDGKRTGILLDALGPGVVTRTWSANPRGRLTITLDGEDGPAWSGDFRAWMAGESDAPAPLALEHAKGFVCEAPIPFAKRCTIACEDPGDLYYAIAWRSYGSEADVRTPTPEELRAGWREAARRLRVLPATWATRDQDASFDFTLSRTNPRGEFVCTQPTTCAGPRAVTTLSVRVEALDVPDAVAHLFVRLTFDGRETVRVPLGDFFGSAPGVNAHESRYTSARPPGDFQCRWPMPYRDTFELAIENTGRVEDVHVSGLVETVPWTFDERTLYFHARWRPSGPLATRPLRDWRHLAVRGRGVFVGDVLTVANPTTSWWGEGDEKIKVDGETFPSLFGTGTEDYYGYAWCSPTLFAAPTCGQTRCDGPGNFGFTSLYRWRVLDVVPFDASFTFEQENWHWSDTTVERAATVFFYAASDATDDAPRLTAREAVERAPVLRVPRVAGALEAEDLIVTARSPGLAVERQYLDPMRGRTWSGGAHLWCRGLAVGAYVEIDVPAGTPGTHEILVYPTKSYDYGRVAFSIDGHRVDPVFDGFNAEAHEPAAPEPVSLGRHAVGARFTLRVEVVGTHERSDSPHFYFGLDAIVVR